MLKIPIIGLNTMVYEIIRLSEVMNEKHSILMKKSQLSDSNMAF